jgi:hypothetical protein
VSRPIETEQLVTAAAEFAVLIGDVSDRETSDRLAMVLDTTCGRCGIFVKHDAVD